MLKKLAIGVCLLVVVVAGFNSIPYRTARNAPLCDASIEEIPCGNTFDVPRAKGAYQPDDKFVPTAFVGLAISGGGSRAANFGLAVMQQLNESGLLEHVTAISSTSGGGLPAAYYSIHGGATDWAAARKLFATDFRAKWTFSVLRPDHVATTFFTHEDRSDLMADIFDELLFQGVTYSSLGEHQPGKPIFLANATSLVNGGRFNFARKRFETTLNSRMDSYPISQAVMASAAFPGAFNSVTLHRYSNRPNPPGSTKPKVPTGYEHFIDGGPTDNLGIESLVELAVSHQAESARRRPGVSAQAPCFFFVVDSYPSGVEGARSFKSDPRGLADFFVDRNFFSAFDSVLTVRRANLLNYVGLGGRGERGSGPPIQPIKIHDLNKTVLLDTKQQLVRVDIPLAGAGGDFTWSRIRPVRMQERTQSDMVYARLPVEEPVPAGYFRCTAWHISLSDVFAVIPYIGKQNEAPKMVQDYNSLESTPLVQHRAKLSRLVSQIDTDFRLAGPKHCSEKVLQDALFAAAAALTREDFQNLPKVCSWFRSAGMSVDKKCDTFPGNGSLSVPLKLKPVGAVVAERYADTAVDCVE